MFYLVGVKVISLKANQNVKEYKQRINPSNKKNKWFLETKQRPLLY